jgi:hypothetical protein
MPVMPRAVTQLQHHSIDTRRPGGGPRWPAGERVARPGYLSAQYGELVPQDGDLDIVGIGRRTAADHAEDPSQD